MSKAKKLKARILKTVSKSKTWIPHLKTETLRWESRLNSITFWAVKQWFSWIIYHKPIYFSRVLKPAQMWLFCSRTEPQAQFLQLPRISADVQGFRATHASHLAGVYCIRVRKCRSMALPSSSGGNFGLLPFFFHSGSQISYGKKSPRHLYASCT